MTLFAKFRLAAALSVVSVTFALSPPTFAQDAPAAPEGETVVARINGEPITDADLALAAQDFRETLAQLPPEQRVMGLINGIIDIRLMARAAEQSGVDKDPEAARRLAFIRDRALRSEYLRANVFTGVTDEKVKALYDEQVAAFVPQEEIRASHILVESEDEAKAIIAELDAGGDFAQIAKDKSIDLGSGANGGDLDYFGRGRMVKPFEDAAFALETGTYTKTPVKSDFGWHIILVADKRMSQPPTLEEATPALREQAAQQLFLEVVDKLRAEAKIEIVAPEQPPAAEGAAPAEPEAAPADPQ